MTERKYRPQLCSTVGDLLEYLVDTLGDIAPETPVKVWNQGNDGYGAGWEAVEIVLEDGEVRIQ